ncbi:MAG: DUF4097 family beta strand repeat-containing protein [Acidobacteriia bacterium]|nr:DUF4097 family beta strand repeat-containing protein [Terriglobia bacterium]
MAANRTRRSSLFSALVLLLFGVLFLIHNYRGGLDFGHLFRHWWPLLLILWGLTKLYERTAARRLGAAGSGAITTGEVFLVLLLLALVGIFAASDFVLRKNPEIGDVFGNSYTYDLDVAPRAVPANARITIRNGRGDIRVRAGDTAQIRLSAKKNIRAWSKSEAQRLAAPASLQIVQEGDAYEVRPAGYDPGDRRIAMDLDVEVPRKAILTIRKEGGNVEVSDVAGEIDITSQTGDIEVREAGSDVSVDLRRGDVKVSGVNGDVKLSGRGGEVEVINATGGLTLDGEFYGPIRAEKVAKGVRFISHRTDLTLTQLAGHLEAGSGNLDIFDSTGNLTLRTNSYDITLDNVTGKLKIDNRDGDVKLRFASPPKEDVEITNKSAGITLMLPAASAFTIAADSHSGDIDSEFDAASLKKTTTESGDAHLEGQLGAHGPKITLKTSYGSIALHKGT